MDTIRFIYFNTNEISKLAGLLKLGQDNAKQLDERYSLATAEGHENYHHCIISDILYEDIMSYPDHKVVEIYDDLVSQYGNDLVSMYVHEDSQRIMDKILNILLFATDKVYKCDTIVVEIDMNIHDMAELDYHSSIPDLIFTVILNNFIVIKNDVGHDLVSNHYIRKIIIKKKEEENEDD